MTNNKVSKLRLIQARVEFIPDGWQLDSVGNTLKIKNSLRKPISQTVRSTMQGPYPYYGPTKIQDYISEYEQDGTYALIGEDGDHFLKYSTMKQTQYISGKCTVNNHAHIIDSTDVCSSEWFYIYFQHRNILNFLSRQGAGRYKLNKATLEELPILVPPLPEQQKIAKILTTWDKAIDTTERLIDNSKQQKKELMQQLLTGKKRLLDENGKPFEGEWEEKSLSELGVVVTDGDRGKEYPKSSDLLTNGYCLFLSAKNVTKRGFVFDETQFITKEKHEKLRKGVVNRGDIILTTRGTVGQTAYYDDSIPYDCIRVNSGMVTLNCYKSSLESDFFYKVTNSSSFKRQIDALTFGSAQPQLTIKIIKSLKVPTPSKREQQKIAVVLTNADKEIELLEQQLADLQQEKKALMQQLLTGKKRVTV